MTTNSEVSVAPFLCCNRAAWGDFVSTQVLASETLGFGRTVELLSLGNWFWLMFSYLKLKGQFDFPPVLRSQRI